MANSHVSSLTALTVGLAIALVGGGVACSDDSASKLAGPGGSSGSSGTGSSGGDGDGGPGSNPGGPPAEEVLFRAVEPDLQKKCGGACHTMGTYKPAPPTFLAPPDAYKSIKAQPGAIVADYYQSTLLQKGAHAGPAVGTDPTFEAKVIEWLKMESAVIQSQKKPSIDPVALKAGPNNIDMTKACIGGLTGVHLTFDAALVGGILSMSNIKVVTGAGTDVHLYKPRFIKVLAKENAQHQTEIPDGAETFSNTDQTFPGGATTTLTPGSAFLTSAGWSPYDFASDKIRIEVDKLEPGKVQVVQAAAVCKNPALFGTAVLPQLRAQTTANGTCGGCHGGGLAGIALNGNDNTVICNQILQKLNTANFPQSLIVTKVTAGATHGGGALTGTTPAQWAQVFSNNAAVF